MKPNQLIQRTSNHVKAAIIGFPNSGKSTLFNACQGDHQSEVDNFLFTTTDIVSTVVTVVDSRLDWLVDRFDIKSFRNHQVTLIDTPGIVENSHLGEGLGLSFLDDIKLVDVLVHVLRGYEDEQMTHYDEVVNPVRDMQTVNHEIMMKDLVHVEHLITSIEPLLRNNQGGIEAKLERETLIEAWEFLSGGIRPYTLHSEEKTKPKSKKSSFTSKRDFSDAPPPTFVMPTHCFGFPLRLKKWTRRQIDILEKHRFISSKPVIYLVNVTKRDYLRSIPSSMSASGRENKLVREVLDAMFAYESMGFKLGTSDGRYVGSPPPSVASSSSSSIASDPLEYKSQSTVASPTLPPISMSIGNDNSTTIELPTESIDRLSSLLSTDIDQPNSSSIVIDGDQCSEEGADDEEFRIGVRDREKRAKAKFMAIDMMDDMNDEGGKSLTQFRLPVVICCCLEFEREITSLSRLPPPPPASADGHGHSHHIPGHKRNFTMNQELSEYDEYCKTNPAHKSVIPTLIDELFKTLGLIRFYTLQISDSQASVWLVRRGTTTPQAAAVIHTNVSRGFIRGEVVNYDDLYNFYISEEKKGNAIDRGLIGFLGVIDVLRLDGLARSQGIKYVINDGDIIEMVAHPHPSGFP